MMWVHPGGWCAIVVLVFLVLTTPASAGIISPLKFKLWFPQWEDNALNGIITDPTQCANEVNDYWTNNSTYPWKCQRALDCILEHTSPSMTQLISSSLVLLGLTPTMLAALGSNIAESSMLALERPTLSLLLCIGSPAVAVKRILRYSDPFRAVEPSPNINMFLPIRPTRQRQARQEHRWVIIAIEYIVALGAIANVIYTSIYLGSRSVSSFDCNNWWYPLLWVLVPGVVHAIGVVAFLFTAKAVSHEPLCSDSLDSPDAIRHTGCSVEGHERSRTIYMEEPTRWTIVLQSVATGFAIGHVLFGTMVFSSLLFLLVSDSIPIILRYAASAVACRFINQFELARMSEKYGIKRVRVLSQDLKVKRIFLWIPHEE